MPDIQDFLNELNGFLQSPNLNNRAIQVLPPAGGWQRTVEQFTNDYAPTMRKFPQRMIVLLIDFDNRESQLSYVEGQIPDDLKERVFILGVQSEPENLARRNSFKDPNQISLANRFTNIIIHPRL